MIEFLCAMPGLDGPTAAWHGLIHVGLAAVIVVSGTVFLALAVLAYVRSAPPRTERVRVGEF